MSLLLFTLIVDEIQVPQQIGVLGESPAALQTQVGFLFRVDPFMVNEICVRLESTVALGTLEW